MRFVRNKICSSGESSSTKSEVSCFRNTIPPRGWEAVAEMPEVPKDMKKNILQRAFFRRDAVNAEKRGIFLDKLFVMKQDLSVSGGGRCSG